MKYVVTVDVGNFHGLQYYMFWKKSTLVESPTLLNDAIDSLSVKKYFKRLS